MAAPDARLLYIKVDYYHDVYDDTTGTRAGRQPNHSRIFTMRVEDGIYTAETEAPFYEQTTRAAGRRETENLLYTLFGAAGGGALFLYVPTDDGFDILAARNDGQGGQRGHIKIAPEEMEYCALSVSEDGIVSALLADAWQAKLVWWRTDRLLAELGPPNKPLRPRAPEAQKFRLTAKKCVVKSSSNRGVTIVDGFRCKF